MFEIATFALALIALIIAVQNQVSIHHLETNQTTILQKIATVENLDGYQHKQKHRTMHDAPLSR